MRMREYAYDGNQFENAPAARMCTIDAAWPEEMVYKWKGQQAEDLD